MKAAEIPRMRARNLRLDGTPVNTPAEVVAWHGAVQAQEYGPASWSLAQRAPGLTPADVDEALATGAVIRTHALRPTWHFLARDDARFVLGLTGPRVQKGSTSRYAQLGLDARTLARVERTILKALSGGAELTRRELRDVLEKSRIDVTGQRFAHMLGHCELRMVICSGAPRGKDNTFAAFDAKVPPAPPLEDTDAIRVLVERYLRSHGPAAIADLGWWASLKASDIRTALHDIDAVSAMVDGHELWWIDPPVPARRTKDIRLLETFDEFIVGYTKSRFVGDARGKDALAGWRGSSQFRNLVIQGGTVIGHWRRKKTPKVASIEVELYDSPSARVRAAIEREAKRFASFYGLESILTI